MRRLFLFLCAIVALLMLATTAAFAGDGKGQSDAVHGKAAQATHGKSGAAQAGALGATASATATAHRQNGNAGTAGQAGTAGRSAEAQHHVILCHRTGSDTNPYVVVNVSVRAWEHGHSTHPAIDGRSDILLKDPAQPGEKMDKSLCPTATQGVRGGGVSSGSASGGGVSGGGQATSGGVAGAHASGNARTQSGGVLGAGAAAATRTLPFTGLPIWLVILAGAGLLMTGIVIRRTAPNSR